MSSRVLKALRSYFYHLQNNIWSCIRTACTAQYIRSCTPLPWAPLPWPGRMLRCLRGPALAGCIRRIPLHRWYSGYCPNRRCLADFPTGSGEPRHYHIHFAAGYYSGNPEGLICPADQSRCWHRFVTWGSCCLSGSSGFAQYCRQMLYSLPHPAFHPVCLMSSFRQSSCPMSPEQKPDM